MTDDELIDAVTERVLQAIGGGYSFAPLSGMKVRPDNTIAYDFDGHVHARGLDLDAGTTMSPPADRRVRWLDVQDVVVADLASIDLAAAGVRALLLTARYPGGSDGPRLNLSARTTGVASFAALQAGAERLEVREDGTSNVVRTQPGVSPPHELSWNVTDETLDFYYDGELACRLADNVQ